MAGATADGVFINYGLNPEEIAASTGQVTRGAGGRAVDIWQVAALDCAQDGDAARAAVGKIVAFGAGYVIGKRDPGKRSVPPQHVEAIRELVGLYSTRPSQADTDLVERLGLTEYLTGRLAICGSPQDCLTQVRAAGDAGASALMFSVGRASDPLKTIDLFGRYVLPALRAGEDTIVDA